jgi:hypothetical protein
LRAGLRYDEKVIDPGAQTERRSDARMVRSWLGGEASPAARFIHCELAVDAGPGAHAGRPDVAG